MAGKEPNEEISREAVSELIETLLCTENGKYYHITKSFQVKNRKMKIYPISQTVAYLNNLRHNKKMFWTLSAIVGLSIGAVVFGLLGGLL